SGSGGAQPSPEVFEARLRAQLKMQMPFFALRSMIDTLELYIAGTQDLTEAYGQIPLVEGANLCLEAPGGGVKPTIPVQVNPCNGGSGQKWSYDGLNSKITNPAGWCLDVVNGDVIVQAGPGGVAGSGYPVTWPQVWTFGCNGTLAQQWTY